MHGILSGLLWSPRPKRKAMAQKYNKMSSLGSSSEDEGPDEEEIAYRDEENNR